MSFTTGRQVHFNDIGSLESSASRSVQLCPPGDIWESLKVILIVTTGRRERECYGHLVSRGRDLVKHSRCTGLTPTAKVYLAPKVNALVEKPCLRANHGYSSLAGNRAFTTHL